MLTSWFGRAVAIGGFALVPLCVSAVASALPDSDPSTEADTETPSRAEAPGDLPESPRFSFGFRALAAPGLGFGLDAMYYPLPWLGVGGTASSVWRMLGTDDPTGWVTILMANVETRAFPTFFLSPYARLGLGVEDSTITEYAPYPASTETSGAVQVECGIDLHRYYASLRVFAGYVVTTAQTASLAPSGIGYHEHPKNHLTLGFQLGTEF